MLKIKKPGFYLMGFCEVGMSLLFPFLLLSFLIGCVVIVAENQQARFFFLMGCSQNWVLESGHEFLKERLLFKLQQFHTDDLCDFSVSTVFVSLGVSMYLFANKSKLCRHPFKLFFFFLIECNLLVFYRLWQLSL